MQADAAPSAQSPASAAAPSLRLRGLTKRYPLFGRRRDRALAFLGRTASLAFKTALAGVDLDAYPGEAIGIIGENGSGKSTLLRMVAGISDPDEGEIYTQKPVAAILELGLGFHPDFSGRENARLYGSLVGIAESDMRDRVEEAIVFAELEEYADQPLRTYSSGMTARLAFSVATHVDPRVLVVDEALAVGDGAFQKKCVDRMVRFKEDGRTILFCSHAMYLVSSFCQRTVWLHEGRMRGIGATHEVVEEYENYLMHRAKRRIRGGGEVGAAPRVAEARAKHGRVSYLRVFDTAGNPATSFARSSGLKVEIGVESRDPATPFHVGVAVDSADGRCVFAVATHLDGRPPMSGRRDYPVRLHIPVFPIGSGSYVVSAFLFDETGILTYDQVAQASAIRVVRDDWSPSLLELAHDWVIPA